MEEAVENGKRDEPRRRGVRYAFGNPGFHYGSGYDIYRMNTPE